MSVEFFVESEEATKTSQILMFVDVAVIVKAIKVDKVEEQRG